MADQDTYSIHYFYKGWSLIKEGDLGREDALKITENGVVWRGPRACSPDTSSRNTIDRPEPSRLDLSLSRNFIRIK